MSWLIKIEKVLFYFLAGAGWWQLRLIWPAGGSFNEWTTFFLYATDLLVAAIFILWAARRLARKPKSDFGLPLKSDFGGAQGGGDFSYETIALGIFLIFCGLSLFIALDKTLAFYRLIKLLEFVGLYFYVRYNFAAFYSLKKFWQCFIVGAALQSAVAVGQFLTQHSLGLKFFAESPLAPDLAGVAKIVVDGVKIVRAYGLVPHPNILAAILVVAIFGLAWLFINSLILPERRPVRRDEVEGQDPSTRLTRSGNKWGRLLFFALVFILLSSALFFTFSRGVIIVGGVLFLAWLAYLWCDAMNRRAILGIFLLFAICYSFLAIIYRPYISSHYDLTSLPENQSVALRSFYNQEAIKMIWQAPLLGVGQGNFTTALRRVVSLPDWQYQPAHNLYLLIAAENGLLASLAFLAFLFFTLKSVWSQRKNPLITYHLSLITFLLIIGFFDHFLWDLQQGQILFWLMLGLLNSMSLRSSAD